MKQKTEAKTRAIPLQVANATDMKSTPNVKGNVEINNINTFDEGDDIVVNL